MDAGVVGRDAEADGQDTGTGERDAEVGGLDTEAPKEHY